jgi:hypothetical protein
MDKQQTAQPQLDAGENSAEQVKDRTWKDGGQGDAWQKGERASETFLAIR